MSQPTSKSSSAKRTELISQVLEPSVDYSSQVPDDFAIRKAIQILHEQGVRGLPRIRINVVQNPRRVANTQTRAFVRTGDPTIYVNNHTDTYRRASKGDRRALIDFAGILAHEQQHVDHGEDEIGAYDRQIDVLAGLKAPKDTIEATIKARDYIQKMLQ
jgi:hypothetical protein